jgi:uncharacterized protein YjlB
MPTVELIQHVNILRHIIQDDGTFPNNGLLPLLVYEKAIQVNDMSAEQVIELFEVNGWSDAWVNGVFDYHHFHSTAHEVLGVIRGSARIQFGGPSGVAILIEKGDVVVIPAGVAHMALDVYDEFQVVGAYPSSQKYDIRKGDPDEREEVLKNIQEVSLPISDPVYGIEGPLLTNWKK